MNTIYLRRQHKVVLKLGNAAQPESKIAVMQKNLESLGFAMSLRLMERVCTLDDDSLAVFYRRFIKELRQLVGAHRHFNPMYPDFPAQVRELPDYRLYLNSIVHYLTNKLPLFAKTPRPELNESTELRVIDLGEQAEFETIFTQLAGARTALSLQDKQDLLWFVSQYREGIERLLPPEITFRENLAVLGAALLTEAPAAANLLDERIRTATDVLRVAVALSGGDVSLARPVKFGRFKRAQRRRMLAWIERSGDPVDDMLRWKPRWIRLGERLHPGDFAHAFPKTYAAFRALRNDDKVATFNSRVENKLAARDVSGVIRLLACRPGELARRVDHLLRISPDVATVLTSFRAQADRVSTPVLLQMMAHFRQRANLPELRVFFPKGDVAKLFAKPCRLPQLSTEITSEVVTICEKTLVDRFSQRPPLGRCYLDGNLRHYMVPLTQRSASKALRTVARGSRMPLAATQVLRFFIWWKNKENRTDIDLSALLFDHQQRHVDHLAYYNLKNFGGCHSGDIVDAPLGASEFIDVELPKLAERSVRYIVMMISSFTCQPYCDLPECFAGWMARQQAESGEIYDPRTVEVRLDVASNTQICIPAIFDLEAQQVIWTDLALTRQPAFSNNAINNLSTLSLMLRAMTTLTKPDLHTLFSLHIRGRGSLVSDTRGADTVFGCREGITPFDVDRIRSEFL